ncbi:hypothetical protein [Brevibacterium zhoupengii]|uniref:hypothetical protein n=1 Tax=Brevibacterium zhoupengii TaxID=2898795 RepID=UPI001E384E44|nr:hypothetical protein [Brevibacterium zhoupengii]
MAIAWKSFEVNPSARTPFAHPPTTSSSWKCSHNATEIHERFRVGKRRQENVIDRLQSVLKISGGPGIESNPHFPAGYTTSVIDDGLQLIRDGFVNEADSSAVSVEDCRLHIVKNIGDILSDQSRQQT